MLLFLLLVAVTGCHAFTFSIERAVTPERLEQVRVLLGDARRGPDSTSTDDEDDPVVRFAAVSSEDDRTLGCVFCQTKRKESFSTTLFLSPYVYLYNLHVDPSARRQRLGTALVERVVEYAIEQQAQGILLSVDCHNAATAVRIYEQMGFALSGAPMEGETPMFRVL